ncbi:MAG: hypothetical protein KA204_00030 [Chromatiaceae bacterium]|nr:hypothetical protein [Chromatiaceae bacterium]MBP8196932.1 hypothetical protein [Chromatiaceae bacterium]
MKLSVTSFFGVAPKIAPRYLPDGAAQVAVNVGAFGQSLKPLRGLGALGTPTTLTNPTGVLQTIYRFGQEESLADDHRYWLRWITDVDVCRSQISGDTNEWTFYTEPDAGAAAYPKATYKDLVVSATPYPGAYLRLGVPAPVASLSGTVGEPGYCKVLGFRDDSRTTQVHCTSAGYCVKDAVFTYGGTPVACTTGGGTWIDQTAGSWIVGAETTGATVTLTKDMLEQVTPAYGVQVSTNGGANWSTANTAGAGAPSVSMWGLHTDQMTSKYGLKISVDGGITWASQAFTGAIDRAASLTLDSTEVYAIPFQPTLTITVGGASSNNGTVSLSAGALNSAQALADGLNAALTVSTGLPLVTATVVGSGVRVETIGIGPYTGLRLQWASNAWRTATGTDITTALNTLKDTIDKTVLNGVALATAVINANSSLTCTSKTAGASVKLIVKWGDGESQSLTATGTAASTAAIAAALTALPYTPTGVFTGVTAAVSGDSIEVTSRATGKDVALKVRWSDAVADTLTGTGATEDLGQKETRVYTYTWVFKEGDFEWESAPWSPDTLPTFDVYPGGSVTLTGFETFSAMAARDGAGWGPKRGTYHQRLYRAVNGVYLFVADLPPDAPSYTDILDADQLGEELPSTLWTPPKKDLRGLINLPNGMMAGFVGREIFFCEPYRPFAWPDTYSQVVDYKVVGLGRMDTTLAVLTEGTPYLIQGSAPDVLVVVKSDIEQACVAKRSIVSMDGSVIYASPDGLMRLSSGGSEILTRGIMGREEWQRLNPSSIHAYGSDSRYVAFYTEAATGTIKGFIYDFKSQQFVMHTFQATCGYHDLRNDTLYLLSLAREVRKWGLGGYSTEGKWRSKIFSQPQMTGYACAQLEAGPLYDFDGVTQVRNAYPETMRVYVDGVLFHTQTITETDYYNSTTAKLLSRRNPFRLPPLTGFYGRDWEVEIDVKAEIFNVALAQSMSELAGT